MVTPHDPAVVFRYDENLKNRQKVLEILKAKAWLILKCPTMLFNSRFVVKDIPPTPFDFGCVAVFWKGREK